MKILKELFENNRSWADRVTQHQPDFFSRLARQQSPQYLWIGCSDSRLPPNDITGLLPGELFVHRNVGNVVVHTDFNCLSVMEYAVVVLKIKHIIVCGHYGCGGVVAALRDSQLGLVDNWLRHIRDIYFKHQTWLTALKDEQEITNRLCELNVIEQVNNVCKTTVVQSAWQQGQKLHVHGWIFGLKDGLLRDLDVTASNVADVDDTYNAAIERTRNG